MQTLQISGLWIDQTFGLVFKIPQINHASKAIFLKFFFDLCFIGSVGFGDHLTVLLLATTLFASASFGGGCSAGAYQQIVKNMQKKILSRFISRRHRSDLHPSSMPSR